MLTFVCAQLRQISESVFSLQTEDGSLVPHDKQVQEAGLFLRCVPAPDPTHFPWHRQNSCCNMAWSWRIRDGRLETRNWCLHCPASYSVSSQFNPSLSVFVFLHTLCALQYFRNVLIFYWWLDDFFTDDKFISLFMMNINFNVLYSCTTHFVKRRNSVL